MKTIKKFKTPEDEVDSWKLKVYEETKDMTSEQLKDYYGKTLEAKLREIGFMFVTGTDNHKYLKKIPKTTNA